MLLKVLDKIFINGYRGASPASRIVDDDDDDEEKNVDKIKENVKHVKTSQE